MGLGRHHCGQPRHHSPASTARGDRGGAECPRALHGGPGSVRPRQRQSSHNTEGAALALQPTSPPRANSTAAHLAPGTRAPGRPSNMVPHHKTFHQISFQNPGCFAETKPGHLQIALPTRSQTGSVHQRLAGPPSYRVGTRGAHLPNQQERRLSGKWAPSAPLLLMVTSRALGPMSSPSRGALTGTPPPARDGGGGHSLGRGAQSGPWAPHRLLPAPSYSPGRPARVHDEAILARARESRDPERAGRRSPRASRPRRLVVRRDAPQQGSPRVPGPPHARPAPARDAGGQARRARVPSGWLRPRLPAASAGFKPKRRFKFWR